MKYIHVPQRLSPLLAVQVADRTRREYIASDVCVPLTPRRHKTFLGKLIVVQCIEKSLSSLEHVVSLPPSPKCATRNNPQTILSASILILPFHHVTENLFRSSQLPYFYKMQVALSSCLFRGSFKKTRSVTQAVEQGWPIGAANGRVMDGAGGFPVSSTCEKKTDSDFFRDHSTCSDADRIVWARRMIGW